MAIRVDDLQHFGYRPRERRNPFVVVEPVKQRLSSGQLRAEAELTKIVNKVQEVAPDRKVRWPRGFRTLSINEQDQDIEALVIVDEIASGPSYLGYNPENSHHPVYDLVVIGDDGRMRATQYQGDHVGEWVRGDAGLVDVDHLNAMSEVLCRTYIEQRMGSCILSHWLEQQYPSSNWGDV
jgi:hypothetical protein